MAFLRLDTESRLVPGSRVMNWGRPNRFKTTAIVETAERPIQFLSLPGEKGYETIPSTPDIVSHVWSVDDLTKVSPGAVIREVETVTAEILSGKHGAFTTIAVEGIHKFYDFCYDDALSDLMSSDTKGNGAEAFRGPAYGLAHKRVMKYLNKLSASTAKNVIVTCWEADRKDDPKSRDKNAPTHKAPALPGMLADAITGEYGVSIRSTLKKTPKPGGGFDVVGGWQILPDTSVQGCAVKIPLHIARQLPMKMPQHYGMLKQLLLGKSVAEVKEMYPKYLPKKEEK